MGNRIITLTTDWGTKDHYSGAVKGKLLSLAKKEITIVDISHDIHPLRVFEAAFVLKNCMDYFPEGTIHLIGVYSEVSEKKPHVMVEYNGCYFIGADNGIFHLMFDQPDKIYEIDMYQDSDFFTFPVLDLYVKVAAALINNENISDIGHQIEKLNTNLFYFSPADTPNSISGVVTYIDSFGNAITNITRDKFREIVKNSTFSIFFGRNELNSIVRNYGDVEPGDLMAIFNSTGMLEIAQNDGNVSSLLGLRINDKVSVVIDKK